MLPVVNGLDEEFRGQMAFQLLDANSDQGQEAFAYFRLRGHPSYVIISPTGEILWTGLGEQERSILRLRITEVLDPAESPLEQAYVQTGHIPPLTYSWVPAIFVRKYPQRGREIEPYLLPANPS